MRGVQKISRKDRPASSEGGILRDFTPDHSWRCSKAGAKRKSELHGDMQKVAEMTTSHGSFAWSNKVSEIPCRVSSDLHEWSNDLGAVSTRGSANL